VADEALILPILPVQLPAKSELAINRKTKALRLDMPPTMRGRADEVIE
jgi:hypothetical protein